MLAARGKPAAPASGTTGPLPHQPRRAHTHTTHRPRPRCPCNVPVCCAQTVAADLWEYIDLDNSKAKVDWSKQSKACKKAYMELACAWNIKPCNDPNTEGKSQKSINGGMRDNVRSACVDQSGAEIWTKPFPDDYRNSAFIFGLPGTPCLPDGTDCADGVKANGAKCSSAKPQECASGTCTSDVCVGKANAATCAKGGECLSGVCTSTKCAALADGAKCDSNAQCASTKCETQSGSTDKACGASGSGSGSGAAHAVLSAAAAVFVVAAACATA